MWDVHMHRGLVDIWSSLLLPLSNRCNFAMFSLNKFNGILSHAFNFKRKIGKKESVTYHRCRFGEAPTPAIGRHNRRLLCSILKLSKSGSTLIFHIFLYLTNCSQILKSYTKLNNSTRQQSAVSYYHSNPDQEVLNLFSKTSNSSLWINRLKNLQNRQIRENKLHNKPFEKSFKALATIFQLQEELEIEQRRQI